MNQSSARRLRFVAFDVACTWHRVVRVGLGSDGASRVAATLVVEVEAPGFSPVDVVSDLYQLESSPAAGLATGAVCGVADSFPA